MKDENSIREFVRFKIYKGCSIHAILSDVCQQFYGTSPKLLPIDVAQWIKNLRCDADNCFPSSSEYSKILQNLQVFEGPPSFKFCATEENDEIFVDKIPSSEFSLPLQIICAEIGNARRAFESRKCANGAIFCSCKMIILSERYAIDVGMDSNNLPALYLVDILHNEKRKLQINGDFSAMKAIPALAALNATHFLCHVSYDDLDDEEANIEDLSDVYLFRLDLDQMQCTILSTQRFNSYFMRILVDSTNPCKFLLCCHNENYEKYANRGKIIANKLEFGDERLDLRIQMPGKDVVLCRNSYKLAGDKFYGLCRNQAKNKFVVYEATFKEGKIHFLHLVKFEENSEFQYEYGTSLWSDNAYYVLMRLHHGECFYLHKFDLNTRKVTKTKLPVHEQLCCASINNGVMLVCTVNTEFQHTWHRIPLNSPDTLLNLSMERLQRDAIFMDDVEYTKFVQKLSPNLRPFGGNVEFDQREELNQHRSSGRRSPPELENCYLKRQKLHDL